MSRATTYRVWFRKSRRRLWEAVGEAGTHIAAVGLIGAGDRHNGDWLILPADQNPDDGAKRTRREVRPVTPV